MHEFAYDLDFNFDVDTNGSCKCIRQSLVHMCEGSSTWIELNNILHQICYVNVK